jgi:hypothetical protein
LWCGSGWGPAGRRWASATVRGRARGRCRRRAGGQLPARQWMPVVVGVWRVLGCGRRGCRAPRRAVRGRARSGWPAGSVMAWAFVACLWCLPECAAGRRWWCRWAAGCGRGSRTRWVPRRGWRMPGPGRGRRGLARLRLCTGAPWWCRRRARLPAGHGCVRTADGRGWAASGGLRSCGAVVSRVPGGGPAAGGTGSAGRNWAPRCQRGGPAQPSLRYGQVRLAEVRLPEASSPCQPGQPTTRGRLEKASCPAGETRARRVCRKIG